MLKRLTLFVVVLWIAGGESAAVPKAHVISFGKWMSVKWPDATGKKLLDLKVRPLYVDTRLKEYTTGTAHELTDRLFAVRRVFRVNDALPEENALRWQWQRGGWLLVDRVSGKVSQLSLPEFDPFYSTASWYRDYVAYCGVSEDGKKLFAVVAQVSRRKPVLKKLLEGGSYEIKDAAADSACPIPAWQRNPSRVSFEPVGAPKQTFAIRGHTIDL